MIDYSKIVIGSGNIVIVPSKLVDYLPAVMTDCLVQLVDAA